ncbi:hypothetical protein E1301_Tti013418 [Triplophysa tibetana]|uniref:Uncharacterized protein n=1 Tax=Triplophysa tibetana TaxID=1572043 RepID=A0A5A9NVJ8_9TELE|nr:hypothetical protein E1301_Tti013418 [Triplophysa tibetana]
MWGDQGLSVIQGPPHPAVRLADSFCVHNLTSVLWLLVTKHVWGWERGVLPVLECIVSAEPPPPRSPSGRRLAREKGRPSRDVELWVTPEQRKALEVDGGCGCTLVLLPEEVSSRKNTNGREVKSGCEQEVMAARDAAVDCAGEEIIQKEEGLREKEGEERLTGRPGVRDR